MRRGENFKNKANRINRFFGTLQAEEEVEYNNDELLHICGMARGMARERELEVDWLLPLVTAPSAPGGASRRLPSSLQTTPKSSSSSHLDRERRDNLLTPKKGQETPLTFPVRKKGGLLTECPTRFNKTKFLS